jgi:acyl-CoA synthetase (AMP-forming)/AMP-acid ligase II
MANIITSPHEPPVLPRSSVINYLFPPANSATKVYYKAPDPKSISFIDGLTGEKVTREEVGTQAAWLAAGLKKLGLKKGDVGMTFGFNSLLYVNAIMGMQHLGCIVSPANAA